MMAEFFFYKWKRDDVWKIIANLIEPTDTELNKTVEDEFKELEEDQKRTRLCKYVLSNEKPINGLSDKTWKDYILPALKSLQKEKYRRFNDPIHGTIELHPLLCKIIDTPEFHRLNDIKQLGGVHYVYPNARHTRFEHSIGVCYLAGEFARTLQKKQPELKITDKDVLCVEIAGLIHDLGHGPFSHMFEYGVFEQLKLEYYDQTKRQWNGGDSEEPSASKKQKLEPHAYDQWEHEMLSQKVFKDRIYEQRLKAEFENYGISANDIDFIIELIHYKTKNVGKRKGYEDKGFLYQIVANKYCGIDVDKWDYFARDGLFIGIAHDFDFNRLMSMSRVIKVDGEWMICFRMKEMNNIYGMFRTRCSLFQRALHHKVKIAAELMLCRAIALAANVIELSVTESEMQPPRIYRNTILEAVLDAQKYLKDSSTGSLDGFLAMTDSIIYAIKVANPKGLSKDDPESQKLEAAKSLLRRVSERNLFREVELKGIELPNPIATDRGLMKHATDVLQRVLDKQLHDLSSTSRSVFLQLVDYKYGSEPVSEQKTDDNLARAQSVLKWNDPVRKVHFYEKQAPMTARPGEHPDLKTQMEEPTTDLVRPKEFSVSQWKVYSDLEEEHDSRIIEVIKDFLRNQPGEENSYHTWTCISHIIG